MILLIKRDELTTRSPLGGNLDEAKYIPALISAQITGIKPILGDELYDKICEDFNTDSLEDDYLILYTNYIKPMMIHLGASYYLTTAAYQIDNRGVMKHKTDNAESASQEEINYIVKQQEKLYQFYKREFYRDIKQLDIPEYAENNVIKKTRKLGGWMLGASGCVSTSSTPGRGKEIELQNLFQVLSEGNDAGGLQIKNVGNPSGAKDVVNRDYLLSTDLSQLKNEINPFIRSVQTQNNPNISLLGDGTDNSKLEAVLSSDVLADIQKGIIAESWGDHSTEGYLKEFDIEGKENVSNKVDSLDNPNSTTYPSTQAIADLDLDDFKNESNDPFVRESEVGSFDGIETADTADIKLLGDGTVGDALKAKLVDMPNDDDVFGRQGNDWKTIFRKGENAEFRWVDIIDADGFAILTYVYEYYDDNNDTWKASRKILSGVGYSGGVLGSGKTNIIAFGQSAAQGSEGNNINAFGNYAAQGSEGNSINAFGIHAARDSEGNSINAFGQSAAQNSKGNYINAFGFNAAQGSEGNNINAFGQSAARGSEGSHINVFGRNSYNQGQDFDNVNIFGPNLQPTKSNQNIISGEEFLIPGSTPQTILDAGDKSLVTVEAVRELAKPKTIIKDSNFLITNDLIGAVVIHDVVTITINKTELDNLDSNFQARFNNDTNEEVDINVVMASANEFEVRVNSNIITDSATVIIEPYGTWTAIVRGNKLILNGDLSYTQSTL